MSLFDVRTELGRRNILDSFTLAMQGNETNVSQLPRLADSGNALAAGYLALLFWQGNQFQVDADKESAARYALVGINWLKAWSAVGNQHACYVLGKMLWDGIGVKQSKERGFALLKTSSDKGNSWAQLELGECFSWGYGIAVPAVSKDIAYKMYSFSAGQDNPKAQVKAAVYHTRGWLGWGTAQSVAEGVCMLRQYAQCGNARAQFQLGTWLLHGTNVPRNKVEARHWFELASNQGLAAANEALALL